MSGNLYRPGTLYTQGVVTTYDHDWPSLATGVAIPHGRIKGLREAAAAFIRMKEPIPFDAPDGKPVDLICILLVPEKATDQHLQVLSELAQMFSDKSFREKLLISKDAAEIHQLIANWAPNVPD